MEVEPPPGPGAARPAGSVARRRSAGRAGCRRRPGRRSRRSGPAGWSCPDSTKPSPPGVSGISASACATAYTIITCDGRACAPSAVSAATRAAKSNIRFPAAAVRARVRRPSNDDATRSRAVTRAAEAESAVTSGLTRWIRRPARRPTPATNGVQSRIVDTERHDHHAHDQRHHEPELELPGRRWTDQQRRDGEDREQQEDAGGEQPHRRHRRGDRCRGLAGVDEDLGLDDARRGRAAGDDLAGGVPGQVRGRRGAPGDRRVDPSGPPGARSASRVSHHIDAMLPPTSTISTTNHQRLDVAEPGEGPEEREQPGATM